MREQGHKVERSRHGSQRRGFGRIVRHVVVLGLIASVLAIGSGSQPVSALEVMPEDWRVSCTSNLLSIDLGTSSPIVAGQGVTVTLNSGGPNFQRSVLTTSQSIDGQQRIVATINLAELSVPLGATFPTQMTTWAVALGAQINGNTVVYVRYTAVTTVVVEGAPTCPPPALRVDVVNAETGFVQRGAQAFAVPVQLCGQTDGFVPLSSGTLGTFILSKGQVPSGFYWIGALAPDGFASAWYDNTPCESATQIFVKPDGSVEPVVIDGVPSIVDGVPAITFGLRPGRAAELTVNGPDGNVLQGACVTAMTWQPGAVWGLVAGKSCVLSNGKYRVPGIAINAPVTLLIEPPPGSGLLKQFLDAQFFYQTTGFTIEEDGRFTSVIPGRIVPREVTLTAAGTIDGVVQKSDGSAAPGVCVEVNDFQSGDFGGANCTDGQGRYSIGVEPNRTYRVRFNGTPVNLGVVFHNGTVTGTPSISQSTLVSVGTGVVTLETVKLAAAVSIPVRVRDEGGSIVRRACVGAWAEGDGTFNDYVSTTCYSLNGDYRIGGLVEGEKYKILVQAQGFQSEWYPNQLDRTLAEPVTASSNMAPLDVSLVSGGGFRVAVKNSNSGIESCIAAYVPTQPGQWGSFVGASCSRTGDVSLGGLPSGSLLALRAFSLDGRFAAAWILKDGDGVIRPSTLEQRSTFVVPSNGDVDLGSLNLAPAVRISGIATVNGVPTAGICADAFAVVEGSLFGTFLHQSCSFADGRYTVAGLPANTAIRLRFSSPTTDVIPSWYRSESPGRTNDPTLATPLTLTASRSDVDIDLQQGSSLRVTVTNSSANPVAGICVNAIDLQGGWGGSACSDSSGAALIRGLAPMTTYRLWMQSNNSSYPSSLALDGSGQPIEVIIPFENTVPLTIRSGLGISGTVTLDEQAVSGACVVARPSPLTGSTDPIACTGVDGGFLLTNLVSGVTYSYSVIDSQDPPRFAETPVPELTDGMTIPLTSSTAPSGDVSLLSDAEVSVSSATPQTAAVVLSGTTSDTATIRWDSESSVPFVIEARVGNSLVFSGQTDDKKFTLLGLKIGVPYRVAVLEESTEIGFLTVRTSEDQQSLPAPPGRPQVERVEGNSASLSWSPVTSPGATVKYVAYLFDAFNNLQAEVSTESPSVLFTGLASPGSYVVRVAALNEVGVSSLSPVSDVIVVSDGGAPGSARNITGEEIPGGLRIDWQPPLDNGGSVSLGYDVLLIPTSSPAIGTSAVLASCSTATTTCSLTDLVPGTTYTVTVEAFSNFGRGPASVPIDVPFVGVGRPSKPRNVVATEGDSRAVVSWQVPTSDGGSPITGYMVTASPGGRTCSTSTALRCTINRLTNGTRYTFSVVAHNAIGSSDPAESAETLIAVPPSAPTRLSAKVLSPSSVRVSWLPPRTDGGISITGYEIRYSTDGGRTWSNWTDAGGSASNEYTITVLPRGTQVIVEVRAINDEFDGASGTTRVRTPSRG